MAGALAPSYILKYMYIWRKPSTLEAQFKILLLENQRSEEVPNLT